MKKIKLYNSKKSTIVDDWNYTRFAIYNWSIDENETVYTHIGGKKYYLGRLVLGLKGEDKRYCDHINHNRRDNREANLRAATASQNGANRKKSEGFTSNYLGTSWHSRDKIWEAQIKKDNRVIYIGRFDNEIDAAKAYDEAAKELHGEFAVLNFPSKKEK